MSGMGRTIEAVADAAAAEMSVERPYVAVVVTDDDRATVIGAYAKRTTAQGRATRESGEMTGGTWLRGYVACPRAGGGLVVMAGPVIIGTVAA